MKGPLLKRNSVLILAAVIVLVFSNCSIKRKSEEKPPTRNSRGDYVTANTCKACHPDIYEEWKDTRHATVLRKLYTDKGHTIDAPWGTEENPREVITVDNHRYTTFMKGDEYCVTIHDSKRSKRDITKRIDAVGYRTQTSFFSYDEENNSLMMLPLMYWADTGEGDGERWTTMLAYEWYKGDGRLRSKLRRGIVQKVASYENRCAECHLTGFEIKAWKNAIPLIPSWILNIPVVSDSNVWEAEFATSCEKCHGPGRNHAYSEDPKDIVNPMYLSGDNKGSECYQCHQSGSSKNNPMPETGVDIYELPYIFNETDVMAQGTHFNVGDNIHDYYNYFERDKWPGTGFWRQSKSYKAMLDDSKHGQAGMTCTSCHNPHSMKTRDPGDSLCIGCHTGGKDTDSHQMAVHVGIKTTCVDCHMPWKNASKDRSRRHDIRGHEFIPVTPSDSLKVFDYLKPYVVENFVPSNEEEEEMHEKWLAIQRFNGDCYDDYTYPPNMRSCVQFDIMPNACSSCHASDFPTPGNFSNVEREKLKAGEERYQRFLESTSGKQNNTKRKSPVGSGKLNHRAEVWIGGLEF